MLHRHSALPADLLAALQGIGVDYTGDMANEPGRGAIVRTHADQWGQWADIALEDGREFKSHPVSLIGTPAQRGTGVRIIATGPAHGAPYMAQLAAAAAMRKASEAAAEVVRRETFERSEAARTIDAPPVFHWNGIKDTKGAKLQKCWYSGGELLRHPAGTITIYARDYSHFSDKVRACFKVENDTDTMTDYFDNDRIRVIPSHPLYSRVKAAMQAQEAHRAQRAAKREQRRA